MNLLIIDDDNDLLKLLKLTFEKEYNVVICDSALKIRPSDLCKYDLIILHFFHHYIKNNQAIYVNMT